MFDVPSLTRETWIGCIGSRIEAAAPMQDAM